MGKIASIFSAPKPPPLPTPAPVTPMPDRESPQLKMDRTKKQREMADKGRAGTNLSAGTTSYTNTMLGQ